MFKLSDFFILLATISAFFLSAWLWFGGNRAEGMFTALWVPGILCFAIYAKLIGLTAQNGRSGTND